jgi:hypothetical protein
MIKLKRHEMVHRIIEETALPEGSAKAQSFTRSQLLELMLYIINAKKIIKELKLTVEGLQNGNPESSGSESIQATRFQAEQAHD